MPLIKRLLTSRKNIDRKNDCKLPVDLSSEIHLRNTLNFGIDEIRILLFRECEWRGRRLIFDSVTASKTHEPNASIYHGRKKSSHSRSGNGLKHESEQEICDNVNLLSEMVFGTVAMTYRGTLFKIHTLDFPSCIICTKVFPAPDHDNYKNIKKKISDDTLGISLFTNDSRSSSDSLKNYNWSSASSGNVSGTSLRKTSTCSSTCSGWDIDIPTIPLVTQQTTGSNSSEQSLQSNISASTSSSGFSSLTSLRRRWLKTASTCLNWSEINQIDEIFGFQMCNDHHSAAAAVSSNHSTLSHICNYNTRRHRTRLGLTLMIKLTPEMGKKIELKLFEHAPQLEAILNRLCHVCTSFNKGRDLIERLHHASFQCTCWLLRLLIPKKNSNNFSLWHEIVLNKTIPTERITNALCRKLDQMCQLFNSIDTKSTNFFLSTVITAVLTHHLGWVNTVIVPKDKKLLESMKMKYPCNPLWIQLNDLYGTLGNPCKKVETVIAGGTDKSAMINAILTFICYFIRSALVERYQVFRDYSDKDLQDALCIIEKHHQKTLSINVPYTSCSPPPPPLPPPFCSSYSSFSSSSSSTPPPPPPPPLPPSPLHNSNISSSSSIDRFKKRSTNEINSHSLKKMHLSTLGVHDNSNIPSLKRTNSLMNKDCDDLKDFNNLIKFQHKLPLKLDSYQDDLDDCEKDMMNGKLTNGVLNSDENNKNIPKTLTLEEFGEKWQLTNPATVTVENDFDGIKQPPVVSMNSNSGLEETNVFFSQLQYGNNKEESQVFFTVGDEEKNVIEYKPLNPVKSSKCNCQCTLAFTRVPSTSAHLPEGVLRKILQRNFPESSKSIERPGTSFSKDRSFGVSCPRCSGANGRYSEGSKLLLETPTNATEVLRTCGTSVVGLRSGRIARSDSLEDLLEMNNFIELPMPRSRHTASSSKPEKCQYLRAAGYIDTLLQKEMSISTDDMSFSDSEYMSGLILQGLIKNTHYNNNKKIHQLEGTLATSDSWLSEIHDDVNMLKTCSFFDHSITEALCIVADVDNWQVGIISNTMPSRNFLLPVGMSRFVADMLEAFAYIWTKYKSPLHCLGIIESKMRTMLLRSEALAEMVMTMDICNVNLNTLTHTLDLDAADIPLLLAVAATHSPQISHRIGFTYT